MRKETPLDEWIAVGEFRLPAKLAEQRIAEVHAGLDQLEHMLDNPPPPKRYNLMDVRLSARWGGVLAMEDLSRAQKLYRRVYETGGTGSVYIQEELLELIARTAEATTIPFWLGLLDLNKPRDTFANKRRDLVCSALGLLMFHDNEVATEALWQSTLHMLHDVRVSAMYAIRQVLIHKRRKPNKAIVQRLTDIATHDFSSAVRYLARLTLRTLSLPVPFDNPGGTYAFKVKIKRIKQLYRTIELRSEQTLSQLLGTILRELAWDWDHLHAFYMNGNERDPRFEVSGGEGGSTPLLSDEAVLGELGLLLKHRFSCNYDFGDNHWFEIEVVGIHTRAEPVMGNYPRVIDSHGDAPEQYWCMEGDE